MKFTALSGGIPLGGVHYLLEVEGKRIAIDCGAAIIGKKTKMPLIADGHIDALFLTHGHLDHIGALPVFVRQHPETPIFGTKVTRRFAAMLLFDSYNIAQQRIERGEKNTEIFFSPEEIRQALSNKRFQLVHRPEWFSPWPGWKIRYKSNGHINGSASIDIETPSGLKILVSIDMSIHDQATIKGAKIAPDFRPDVIITEGTYGDRELWNRRKAETQLVNCIESVIDRKGFVLIPAYAISGVNIALIPALAGFKTYIDGMIRKAARIVNKSNEWSPNDNVVFSEETLETLICVDEKFSRIHREEILAGEPTVIVSSHGMLEGGAVMEYLPRILEDPKSAIFIPGYQAEETGGYKLLRLLRGQNFTMPDGREIPVLCEVKGFHLSAHAPGRHIAEWVDKQFPWLVIVTHATKAGFEGLKRRIRERNPVIRVAPAYNGEEINWK